MKMSLPIKLVYRLSSQMKCTPDRGVIHDWKLSLVGPNDIDIRQYVDKIVFFSHKCNAEPLQGESYITYTIHTYMHEQ